MIPAPGAEDYSHVAIGEGSVWVTADGGNVLRVDASRVRVVSTIHTDRDVLGPMTDAAW